LILQLQRTKFVGDILWFTQRIANRIALSELMGYKKICTVFYMARNNYMHFNIYTGKLM